MARKIMMMLTLGVALTTGLTAELLAQGHRRDRWNGYGGNESRRNWNRNTDDRDYRDDRYYGDDRGYGNRRERRNPQDTAGKALARTGIGAGIGAGAGALLGGGKGALIGATAGAVGGLIYHESKVSRQRNRRRW